MKIFRNSLVTLFFFSLIFSCKTTNVGVNTDTKVRYIEMYESICCPRDYKHDTPLKAYIKTFETQNKVSLKSNFKLSLGREGETAYFLSLENISSKLREKFVNERIETLKKDDKSIINHLEKPISIEEALKMWENISTKKLIKF